MFIKYNKMFEINIVNLSCIYVLCNYKSYSRGNVFATFRVSGLNFMYNRDCIGSIRTKIKFAAHNLVQTLQIQMSL
jgi:hypothetical protein